MSWDYGCYRTGKRRYPSLGDAAEATHKLAHRGKSQRPYHCEFCGGYHLTHYRHETRPVSWHARHHKQQQVKP